MHDKAEALQNAAVVAFRDGDTPQAIDLMGKAIALNPNWVFRFNRGVICLKSARFAEAFGDFSHILKLQPDHYQALVNAGHALKGLNRFAEAMHCFDVATTYMISLTRQP